jgi:hypothetical protein
MDNPAFIPGKWKIAAPIAMVGKIKKRIMVM